MTWWRRWSKERHRDVRAARQKRKTGRDEFIRHALEAAARAEAEGNPAEMHDCTHKLLRVELYERAWELPSRPPDWNHTTLFPDGTVAISLAKAF